jgi:beta-carotene 3-hydroxylase
LIFAIIPLVAVVTALSMEPWAEFVHRKVWHGPLWSMHKSHHRRLGLGRPWDFEWNDVLSASHAPVSITAIFSGIALEGTLPGSLLLGIGIGMALFGVAYMVVHDGFVHQRLPVAFLGELAYFRRIREEHLSHHRGNHGPYGLFRPRR